MARYYENKIKGINFSEPRKARWIMWRLPKKSKQNFFTASFELQFPLLSSRYFYLEFFPWTQKNANKELRRKTMSHISNEHCTVGFFESFTHTLSVTVLTKIMFSSHSLSLGHEKFLKFSIYRLRLLQPH